MSATARNTIGGPYPIRSYPSRLPRGPHSLSRDQVAANQRLRVGMAMLESVGENGYVATTVADVVARAGVSRKAFYEHFANKEACFLATYDAIATEGRRRIGRALREAADAPDRTQAAIGTLFEAAAEHPDALRLTVVEVGAVGRAGLERRERAVAELGKLIGDGLRTQARARGQSTVATLPDPTLRAMVGGVNRILLGTQASARRVRPAGLVPDLAQWISTYQPFPKAFAVKVKSARARHRRTSTRAQGGRAPGTLSPRPRHRMATRPGHSPSRSFVVHNQRERVLDAVTNLAAARGYGALTVEDVAAEAAVSLQAFYEHFESKEDAFIVAYELGHTRGLDIVEGAMEQACDWRTGVRDGLVGLTAYLASEPAFAQLALMGTTVATQRTNELSEKGLAAYAQLLKPGLEELPKSRRAPVISVDAAVGGLREMFLHYVAQGRTQELPELTVDATYVALAPFIGAQEAAELAIEPI